MINRSIGLTGLALSVTLGSLIYFGGVRINLSRFFRVTGFVLVLVAAGLLATSAHTGHEAGWINGMQGQAVDLSWLVQPGAVTGSLLTGMLGLQPRPTEVEVIVYLLFAIPMGLYVIWPDRWRLSKLLDTLRRQPSTATAQTEAQ